MFEKLKKEIYEMDFVKKPIVIQAEQWHPTCMMPGIEVENTSDHLYYYILTLEGKMTVHPGDWIITGVAGEKYPCKDEIFRMTYEPVLPKGLVNDY